MRRLFWIIIVALLLWSGYWAIGAFTIKRSIGGWLAGRAAEGWQADVAGVSTSGYPMRFNITLNDISLSDPDAGFSWKAPQLLVASRAYMPNHLLAKWPQHETFSLHGLVYQLDAGKLVTSLRLAATPDLALSSFRADGEQITLIMPDGARLAARTGFLATRQSVARPNAHDLYLETAGLSLPDPLRRAIDPGATLPAKLDLLKADLTASFDRPLDRKAFEGSPPHLQQLEIRNASMHWGGLELGAGGSIRIGVDGIPEGSLQIKARGWERMLALAAAAGMFNSGQADTIRQALVRVGTLSEGGQTLEVPLDLHNGWASLGGVPISPLPRF